MENYETVKNDFNEIAQLPDPPAWNHNSCYFPYIMKHLPDRFSCALEIGCGQGELCALLAERAGKVIGIDLADQMIKAAQARNSRKNIEYRCGNILDMEFDAASMDVIVTAATAHHLPFGWLLEFSKRVLKPGGVLVILDLMQPETGSDKLLSALAVLPNLGMNLLKNGSLREDPHSAAVWKKHGAHDHYLTFREVRRAAAESLPNAYTRRLLFWRYVLIWKKPKE